MDELKPCPFCGGQGAQKEDSNYNLTGGETMYHVQCKECGADGPWEYSEQASIYVWNKRD